MTLLTQLGSEWRLMEAVERTSSDNDIDMPLLRNRIEASRTVGGAIFAIDELRDLISTAENHIEPEQTVAAELFIKVLLHAIDSTARSGQTAIPVHISVAEKLVELAGNANELEMPRQPASEPLIA